MVMQRTGLCQPCLRKLEDSHTTHLTNNGCLNIPLEPPRLSRRVQILRGWSHDKTEPVLTGSADAGSADGPGARSGARLTVGGHHFDRREDRLYRRDAPEVGPADGA